MSVPAELGRWPFRKHSVAASGSTARSAKPSTTASGSATPPGGTYCQRFLPEAGGHDPGRMFGQRLDRLVARKPAGARGRRLAGFVRNGSHWDIELRFRGIDGSYHPILARGSPVRDADGKVICWAGINLDLSGLKQAEERLREGDRRKDEFLATLAHELRNPLAPIRNAVRLLRASAPATPDRSALHGICIDRQVGHMIRLVDDLLDVVAHHARQDRAEQEPRGAADRRRSRDREQPAADRARRHACSSCLPREAACGAGRSDAAGAGARQPAQQRGEYTEPGGRIRLALGGSEDDQALVASPTPASASPPSAAARIRAVHPGGPLPTARRAGSASGSPSRSVWSSCTAGGSRRQRGRGLGSGRAACPLRRAVGCRIGGSRRASDRAGRPAAGCWSWTTTSMPPTALAELLRSSGTCVRPPRRRRRLARRTRVPARRVLPRHRAARHGRLRDGAAAARNCRRRCTPASLPDRLRAGERPGTDARGGIRRPPGQAFRSVRAGGHDRDSLRAQERSCHLSTELRSSFRAACLAAGLALFALGAGAREAELEYPVKAIFLLRFAQFTEWPAAGPENEPFVIAVLETTRSVHCSTRPFAASASAGGRSRSAASPTWTVCRRFHCCSSPARTKPRPPACSHVCGTRRH